MQLSNNQQAFLELVRAGLWTDIKVNGEGVKDKGSSFTIPESVDWEKVYQLAEEQSVVGIVLAGIERLRNHNDNTNLNISQEALLQMIGEVQMIEQQNKAMNTFVVWLIEKLGKDDVYALLVKGQGVAQCYKKPLWRASGDIDLLLDEKNYKKAEKLLVSLADEDQGEDPLTMHHAVIINDFDIELHGKMPFLLSKRVDRVIDEAIADALKKGGTRLWYVDGTDIYLPNPDNDVILVWTHMLHHFFIEGVGLRQVCDWCRLLYTFKDSLNYGLLESRIRRARLMSEWKAFGSLAVDELSMPKEAMPMYDSRFRKRGQRVLAQIMKSGNMGHNNDLSYRVKYTGLKYKAVAFWRRLLDFMRFVPIFPVDAPKFFICYVLAKLR